MATRHTHVSFEQWYAELLEQCAAEGDTITPDFHTEEQIRWYHEFFEVAYGMRPVSEYLKGVFNNEEINAMMESGAALHPWLPKFIRGYMRVDLLVQWHDQVFIYLKKHQPAHFKNHYCAIYKDIFFELRSLFDCFESNIPNILNLPYMDYEEYDYSDRIYQNNVEMTLDQVMRVTQSFFSDPPRLYRDYLRLVADTWFNGDISAAQERTFDRYHTHFDEDLELDEYWERHLP